MNRYNNLEVKNVSKNKIMFFANFSKSPGLNRLGFLESLRLAKPNPIPLSTFQSVKQFKNYKSYLYTHTHTNTTHTSTHARTYARTQIHTDIHTSPWKEPEKVLKTSKHLVKTVFTNIGLKSVTFFNERIGWFHLHAVFRMYVEQMKNSPIYGNVLTIRSHNISPT